MTHIIEQILHGEREEPVTQEEFEKLMKEVELTNLLTGVEPLSKAPPVRSPFYQQLETPK